MRPDELKLLVIFDVIMTEKSITQAANRLAMTQPAVSNAVSKMRVLWKDKLFVPDGRTIQPTTYANNLWSQVRDSLKNINQFLKPEPFEAKSAKRTFRIAIPDLALNLFWLELRKLFEREAPGLNLYAVPYTITGTKSLLYDAEVDLVIGQSNRSLENICSKHLFDTSYVCVMRKHHPLAKKQLTVEAFSQAEHLLVSLSGNIDNPTDQALQQVGLTRRIALTVNNFLSAIPIIKETNLIAILATELLHNHLDNQDIVITQPPISIPHTSISMLWHNRQSNDKGLIWLRNHISRISVTRRAQQVKKVRDYIDSTIHSARF